VADLVDADAIVQRVVDRPDVDDLRDLPVGRREVEHDAARQKVQRVGVDDRVLIEV
jgi:hypothetical protein